MSVLEFFLVWLSVCVQLVSGQGSLPNGLRAVVPVDNSTGACVLLLAKASTQRDLESAIYVENYNIGTFQVKLNDRGQEEFSGSFLCRKKYYRLRPLIGDVPPGEERIILGGVAHSIIGQDISLHAGESYLPNVVHNPTIQIIIVELLVHIDYTVYFRWLSFKNNDEEEAIKGLRSYYFHIIHGVRALYERIQRSDFSISVNLKKLYVSKNSSIYAARENVTNYRFRISDSIALDNARDWANLQPKNSFDAAVFLGNLDMGGTLGLAPIRSICTENSYTVVTIANQLELIQTITHELGHILGSHHDGIFENDCVAHNLFIMTPSLRKFGEQTRQNIFRFSTCSITYFKMMFERLDSIGNNCLLNPGTVNQDSAVGSKKLGQKYSIDEQCRLLFGPESYYCGGEKFCHSMFCYSSQKGRCIERGRQSAADGTPCGNKKWCYKARCVEDEEAPPAERDTCIYGEFTGSILTVASLNKCTNLSSEYGALCYRPDGLEKCCLKCPELYRPEEIGCEYGNKVENCGNRVGLNPSLCRIKSVNDECCRSCSEQYTQPDRGSLDQSKAEENCKDDLYCYLMDTSGCYSSWFRDSCCFTCAAVKNETRKGCEYGDKYSLCRNSECSIDCCAKCSDQELKDLREHSIYRFF